MVTTAGKDTSVERFVLRVDHSHERGVDRHIAGAHTHSAQPGGLDRRVADFVEGGGRVLIFGQGTDELARTLRERGARPVAVEVEGIRSIPNLDRDGRLYIGFPADHPAVNTSRRFQVVTGACLLIRREVFEALAGFDTAYLNGFEDVDLCLRAGVLGHEIRYRHESELYHLESMSEGRTTDDSRNERIYRARWADRVRPDDWLYYLEDGLIRVDYGCHTPLRFTLSHQLGITVDRVGVAGEAERLLALRAEQVNLYLRENIILKLALAACPWRVPAAGRTGRRRSAMLKLLVIGTLRCGTAHTAQVLNLMRHPLRERVGLRARRGPTPPRVRGDRRRLASGGSAGPGVQRHGCSTRCATRSRSSARSSAPA